MSSSIRNKKIQQWNLNITCRNYYGQMKGTDHILRVLLYEV